LSSASPKDKTASSAAQDAPLSELEESLIRFGKGLLLFYLVFTLVLGFVLWQERIVTDFSNYFKMSGFDPMNASGIAALYVAFLCCRPGRNLLQLSFLLGAIAEVLYQIFVLPVESVALQRVMTIGGGFGLIGLLLMVILFFQRTAGPQRDRVKAYLLAGLCVLFYPVVAGKGIGVLSQLTVEVYDSHVYGFTSVLGFYPAAEVSTFLIEHPYLFYLSHAIYSRLPLFIFLGFWLSLRYPERSYSNILYSFILGGFLAFPIYFVIPMVGIDLYLGSPPWPFGPMPTPQGFELVRAPMSFPRTCFPSLHTTWVLVFFLTVCRISRTAAVLGGGVVVLTLLGSLSHTVGHHFVDILVAVPFSLAAVAFATKRTERNHQVRTQCLVFGIGTVVAWAFLFRWVPTLLSANGGLFWGLMVAFCLATPWLERRLARASLPVLD
jgi:hypothetical protein